MAAARFHLAVVNFHVEFGQQVETLLSSSSETLPPPLVSRLALAAMPDSTPPRSEQGVCFAFRLRYDGPTGAPDGPLVWGVALFRARRDASASRGCVQKSVVIISPLPWVELMRLAIERIGTAYFDAGEPALHTALAQLAAWPRPEIGSLLRLPLLGAALESNGSVPRRGLRAAAAACWSCWQLMLCAEPIVVFAASPESASDLVLALSTLIAPLPFAGAIP